MVQSLKDGNQAIKQIVDNCVDVDELQDMREQALDQKAKQGDVNKMFGFKKDTESSLVKELNQAYEDFEK